MANAIIDASQVTAFANRLSAAAQRVEREAESFQDEWGGKLADEMRATVAIASGRLRDSILQVEPGGITFGDAFYWRFLEYGTSRMAPQPFVRPAAKRIRKPAEDDAARRALRLIHGR